MPRSSLRLLAKPLLESRRGFCTSSDKIVASVLFERLRVVIPKPDPAVYAFQEFKFNWQQQFRRRYPDEFLDIAKNSFYENFISSLVNLMIREYRAKGEYQMDYVPAPRITEADKNNDRKALDKKLYLLIFGKPFGATSDKPVWHFPEKVYDSEPTLRKCAESALKSVVGDLTHTYFVGNAPMAHMAIQPTEEMPDLPSYKARTNVNGRFFFKCSVVAASKYDISNCEDFVWVTKDELLEFFPEQAEFFNKMIIS
ncbi:T5E21.12 [Arabidopsis thaliana]|uniref:Large ribosomal subunit protein mL46 n=1 Tax=Arabidopsis thaliana TaxID=3702 RepID=Q9MA21_ARATH|nr:T5E21.12 [Arabidopsis thaliana]